MLFAAIALLAAGALITATTLVPWSFDFAIAVMPGWHVTVFPPPLLVGLFIIVIGAVALLKSAS